MSDELRSVRGVVLWIETRLLRTLDLADRRRLLDAVAAGYLRHRRAGALVSRALDDARANNPDEFRRARGISASILVAAVEAHDRAGEIRHDYGIALAPRARPGPGEPFLLADDRPDPDPYADLVELAYALRRGDT